MAVVRFCAVVEELHKRRLVDKHVTMRMTMG
jgi:hypothetical protein